MTSDATHTSLRIGELANELGLNPKTIRYYEAIGLLPQPVRSRSGYRRYGSEDRERLQFIASAKQLGLTLQQIGEIFAIRHRGEPPCAHVVALLDQKVAAVQDQIRALTTLRRDLLAVRQMAEASSSCGGLICGIIEGQPSISIDVDDHLDLPVSGKM